MNLPEILKNTETDGGESLLKIVNHIQSLRYQIKEQEYTLFLGNTHNAICFLKEVLKENDPKDFSLKISLCRDDDWCYVYSKILDGKGNIVDFSDDDFYQNYGLEILENFNTIYVNDDTHFGNLNNRHQVFKLNKSPTALAEDLVNFIFSPSTKKIYLNALLEGKLSNKESKIKKAKI